MDLRRGRSSRFKLLKSRILSYHVDRLVKEAETPSAQTNTPERPKRVKRSEPERERASDSAFFDDSSTFSSEFSEFSDILNARLLKSLESNGFVRTTPIQRRSIPRVLEGRTALIRSASGTGKTLTFLVPAIQRLVAPPDNRKISRSDGTKVLIVSPTRELSFQISRVAESLSKPFPWIVVSCIKGGESRKSEKARIRKGITVVVGTPGRVLDHMESTAAFNLANLDMFVLDEADRLLDMGFEAKIRTIHSHLLDAKSSNRENAGIQVVLTSATITDRVTKLVDTCFASKPLMIGLDQEQHKVPATLTLEYALVDCNNKFMCLVSLLLRFTANREKIMIFVSNCDTVNYMEKLLSSLTWPGLAGKHVGASGTAKSEGVEESELEATPSTKGKTLKRRRAETAVVSEKPMFQLPIFKLHGDMESKERMPLMEQFIQSEASILISTDVASRGLNLSRVSRVIQYDPPQQLDEFVHRSGRTARIGDAGSCLLLLMRHEAGFVALLNRRGMALRELPEQALWAPIRDTCAPKRLRKFKGDLVGFLRNRFCARVRDDEQLLSLGKSAFKSSIRSYKTYSKELRRVFDFRRLHLGHFATAFCLSMKPTQLVGRRAAGQSEAGHGQPARRAAKRPKLHSDSRPREPRLTLDSGSHDATERALEYLKRKGMIL